MPLLETDVFLNDIAPERPAGDSLRYTVYESIREAKREDDALPKGVWEHDLKVSDWGKVEALCVEALTKQSKDLQIVGWLSEAWMMSHGLEGLRRGFEIFEKMEEKYWDILHPAIELDGDLGFRLSPYFWVNEKFSEKLRVLPLFRDGTVFPMEMTLGNYLSLKNYWGLQESGAAVPKEKEESLKDFEKGVSLASVEFLTHLKEQISGLTECLLRIEAFASSKCGTTEAPSFHRFRSILGEMGGFSDQALQWKSAKTPQAQVSPQEVTLEKEKIPVSPSLSTSQIPGDVFALVKGREDAYHVIGQLADYLEGLDPHSPVPPMIKRALKLGKMPLKDVLQEVIQEPNVLSSLKSLFGFGSDVKSNETSSKE